MILLKNNKRIKKMNNLYTKMKRKNKGLKQTEEFKYNKVKEFNNY